MTVISYTQELDELREQLKKVDAEIIELVAKRITLAKKIGKIKKENNLECYQPQRYHSVVTFYEKEGLEKGLDSSFTSLLADVLHNESLRLQNHITENDD